MDVQMYWLLVKKEYIIVFVDVFLAIANNTVWITPSKRVANIQPNPRSMLAQPRPKCIVVNLVYSNHV